MVWLKYLTFNNIISRGESIVNHYQVFTWWLNCQPLSSVQSIQWNCTCTDDMVENGVRCQDAATYWRNIVANHGLLVKIVFLVVYFIFTLHQKKHLLQESFPVWHLGAQGRKRQEPASKKLRDLKMTVIKDYAMSG